MAFPWITALTAVPVAGAVAVASSGRNGALARRLAVSFGALALLVSLAMVLHFDRGSGAMQFGERHAWVPALSVEYRVGADGLGLSMLLLSSLVTLIAMAASWHVETRAGLYFAFLLLLEACLFGTFTALNFVHWFAFWELSLVPAFFLIKLWGGPRSGPAAMQFLVYTMAGSVALLLSFLALFLATHRFDFAELADLARTGQLRTALLTLGAHRWLPRQFTSWLFVGALLGFAVKTPLLPFHTWLPSTYAEAPSGTTAMLTGAMSKMGLYGFLRILLPIFPAEMQAMRTPLLWLAVASVVLPAYAALVQKDLKRIFAYSSINHVGYCLLAIFAVTTNTGSDPLWNTHKVFALDGAILQMFNHGLTAATLFWFIALLERRSGALRGLHDFGGLRKAAPVFTGLMGIALFSSLGLPGLNGFIGEFLIFRGSFPLTAPATSVAALGLLVTAVVILGVLQRVFSGPLPARWNGFADLTTAERAMLAPAIALMFALGLYPGPLVGLFNATAMRIVQELKF